MVSPQIARDWILPNIQTEMQPLERSLFHLDGPQALRLLDLLLDLPQLDAVQWVYGSGNGPASNWIDVYKRIQNAGKSIQLIAETAEGARTVVDQLKPQGVWISVIEPFNSVESAQRFVDQFGN
jgi:hypothetical protein